MIEVPQHWLRLSDEWCQKLLAMGETGMGYQIASVILNDGRKFERVTIMLPFIAEVPGYQEIPFQEQEICNITVSRQR